VIGRLVAGIAGGRVDTLGALDQTSRHGAL
jgi:hypothetical protein